MTRTKIDIDSYNKEKERIIGKLKGANKGPTIIFIAGMHGNEPAGVLALKEVIESLDSVKHQFKGTFYAIAGNLPALEKGIRFKNYDLNRLWTSENIKKIEHQNVTDLDSDWREFKDIYETINSILKTEDGPFYFFDLHTTSSKTTPFITVNDSLLNRNYTSQYPVPIILGIEEYLDGALLSYINELGYIAFGFEGGQHVDPASKDNHIAFIYLSMVFAGSLGKTYLNFEKYHNHLMNNSEGSRAFFEIFMKYEIKPFEQFEMYPGFINFQSIRYGEQIAKSNGKTITASHNCQIFMPLYQGKGNDGFFMIRKIPKVFLQLSKLLRKIHFDRILPLLPGVSWASPKKDELVVNLKIARFFTKKFLHLLGYRSKRTDKTYLRVKNRESASRDAEYPHFS